MIISFKCNCEPHEQCPLGKGLAIEKCTGDDLKSYTDQLSRITLSIAIKELEKRHQELKLTKHKEL